MARLLLFCVSEQVSLDRDTNALSLFNILTSRSATQFPALSPSLAVITVWEKTTDETFEEQVKLVSPSGKVLAELMWRVEMRKPFNRVIGRVVGLMFEEPGRHAFEVRVRQREQDPWGDPVTTFPLAVSPPGEQH